MSELAGQLVGEGVRAGGAGLEALAELRAAEREVAQLGEVAQVEAGVAVDDAQRGQQLGQRCVAAALADATDRGGYPRRPRPVRGQRVGDRHAQHVVRVDLDLGPVDRGDVPDHLLHLPGRQIGDGLREPEPVGAGLEARRDIGDEPLLRRTGAVLATEGDVEAVVLGHHDRRTGQCVEELEAGRAQLELRVLLGGRDREHHGPDAQPLRLLQGLRHLLAVAHHDQAHAALRAHRLVGGEDEIGVLG